MAMTKLENVIKKEILADYIDAKLVDKIQLSPLMVVDRTLENAAGDTVSFPQFAYIGDADEMVEGTALDTAVLSATETKVTVKQVGKAVEVSDKAMLAAHGDIVGESVDQIITAIASKIEKDAFTELEKATLTHAHTGVVDAGVVCDAQVKFGEDLDEEIYVFMNPKHVAAVRKDANFVANQVAYSPETISLGSKYLGQVYGCQVVSSNRVPENTMYLVKKDALGLVLKRNAEVETERDILKKSTVVAGDQHYAVYLRNQAKVVKVTISQ